MAKLAEQAERYDEMLESMKSVAAYDTELTVEERNLLSVAYKNVIGARRASWRIISCIESKEESLSNGLAIIAIKSYRVQVNQFSFKFLEFSVNFIKLKFSLIKDRKRIKGNMRRHSKSLGQTFNSTCKLRRVKGILLQNER